MLKNVKIWIAFISLIAGFILGRCTISRTIRTEYVQGVTIRDTIQKPVPYIIFESDTVKSPALLEHDTAWIVKDYSKKSLYKETLFKNDTSGECTVEAEVQYNALQRLSYAFTPITKVVTITKTKVYTPFVSASASTLGMFSVGGGVYYNNLGGEVRYITDFTTSGLELGVLIKF